MLRWDWCWWKGKEYWPFRVSLRSFYAFQVEGMRKPCIGSLDKSKPKEIKWESFPHRLFFAREHTATWGPGGVAFLHPESNSDEKAYLCLYRITYVILSFIWNVSPFMVIRSLSFCWHFLIKTFNSWWFRIIT